MADWPVQHPCEQCGTRVQYRVWVANDNLALCGRCWLVRFGREGTVVDQKQDSGPYQLYGRRTAHEPEVRVGSHDDLDKAKAECDDMVDSGVWAHAVVRDRNDQTVHVGELARERGHTPHGDDMPPAA